MAGGSYFKEHDITNTVFTDSPTILFEFIAAKILIVMDTENEIEWSFNGRDFEGKLLAKDKSITLSGITTNKLWLRSSSDSGSPIRVWAGMGDEQFDVESKTTVLHEIDIVEPVEPPHHTNEIVDTAGTPKTINHPETKPVGLVFLKNPVLGNRKNTFKDVVYYHTKGGDPTVDGGSLGIGEAEYIPGPIADGDLIIDSNNDGVNVEIKLWAVEP